MSVPSSTNLVEKCYICHDNITLKQDLFGEWKAEDNAPVLIPNCVHPHPLHTTCFNELLQHHAKQPFKNLPCGACRNSYSKLLSYNQRKQFIKPPEVDAASSLVYVSSVLSVGIGLAAGLYQGATRDEDDANGSSVAIAATTLTASLTIVPIVFFQARSAYQRSGLNEAVSRINGLFYEAFFPAS